MTNERKQALELIRECLVDYSSPLFIIGNIDEINLGTNNVVSLLEDKRNFIILNEKYPSWVIKSYENVNNMFNIVVFKDFDKLSLGYYFFCRFQEKDFFDKKEKINRRLNINLNTQDSSLRSE